MNKNKKFINFFNGFIAGIPICLGYVWINVKCDTEWIDFWRKAFKSVIPAYHLNKTHWNSIILDGTVPDKDICRMIDESYELTGPKLKRKNNKIH